MKYGKISVMFLSATLMMFLFVSSVSATMKMSPYLQAVTTNSIYVLVECDSTSTVTVEYGPTNAYGWSATTESTETTTNSTYIHNIKIMGLQANTLYHYRASQSGVYSSDYTFYTAVNPGTNFRFAFVADHRSGTSVHDTISTRVKNTNPRFSLYGGDLCYDPTYTYYKNEFFRANELSLIANVPFFNTPGNHEDWAQNTKAFTQGFGVQDYYSFDYGDAHFVMINNEISYAEGSAQWNFVANDLQNTTKSWKIVFFHQPAYCSGGHGENSTMKTMSTKLFEPNKVDLVLTGHSHFYQHNLMNGIRHLVIGGGGASLSTPSTATYTVKSVKDYCYAIIDMTPTSLHLVVYEDGGNTLDTLDLYKSAPTATPTASPTSTPTVTATSSTAATPTASVTATPTASPVATPTSSGGSVSPTKTPIVFAKRVATGTDDGEENISNGSMYLTSTDLEMIADGSTNQQVGIRFTNVTVPKGATITKAYIQFTCDEVSTNTATLVIKGQAADNPGTFTTSAYNISSRTRTSANVSWAPAAWNTVGEAGTNQRTPELKTIIQEIVNRTNWASGYAMVIFVTGTNGHRRCAEAYNGSSSQAPLLYIEYTN